MRLTCRAAETSPWARQQYGGEPCSADHLTGAARASALTLDLGPCRWATTTKPCWAASSVRRFGAFRLGKPVQRASGMARANEGLAHRSTTAAGPSSPPALPDPGHFLLFHQRATQTQACSVARRRCRRDTWVPGGYKQPVQP